MEDSSIIVYKGSVGNIYEIRGLKVMLDRDLAELYGVETKVLNQAVRRNVTRFPKDFMITLTQQELSNLKSQIVTSSWGGRRKLPAAFTEHGILMLSSVLKSKRAVKVNIQIMRAFVVLRESLIAYSFLKKRLDEIEEKYDEQFKVVFEAVRKILEYEEEEEEPRKIGFRLD